MAMCNHPLRPEWSELELRLRDTTRGAETRGAEWTWVRVADLLALWAELDAARVPRTKEP